MRNSTRNLICAASRTCEVHATIYLAKNRRINIDRELDSLLDALAVDGSVAHVDAVFIRVYRGTGKGGVRDNAPDTREGHPGEVYGVCPRKKSR